MGRIHHRTAEITVWSGARGLYHACCDCGWDDKPRWLKSTAQRRVLDHANKTGHQPSRPLFISLLPTDMPAPRPRLSVRWRRLTPWWLWLVLGAVIVTAVGVLAAPDAGADAISDVAFVSTLDQFGVSYPSASAAVALGHVVCDVLDGGTSPGGAAWLVSAMTGYSSRDANTVVGAAIGSYCDHHIASLGTGKRLV